MRKLAQRLVTYRLGPRSFFGAFSLWLLVAFCLLELNGLVFQATGKLQAFSYVILALSILTLVFGRFTLLRDLGTSGWAYMTFLGLFIFIGAFVGVTPSAESIAARYQEMRLLLAGVLLTSATAVGVSHFVRGFSFKWGMRWMFLIAWLVPLSVFVGIFFPGIYAYREGIQEAGRHTGFYGNPNEAGMAICISAAAGFACLTYEKRRLICFAGLATAAFAVVLTFSRASILAFGVIAGVQLFALRKQLKVSVLLGVLLVLGGIGVYLARLGTAADDLNRAQFNRLDRLKRIVFQLEFSEETTGGRFKLAMNGVYHWLQSPLIGHGLGGQRRIGEELGAHNSFVRVLGEGGIVPGIAMFAFVFVAAYQAWRCKIAPVRSLALAVVFLFFMSSMTNHGVLQQRYHNIILGIAFGMLSTAKHFEKLGLPAARVRRLPGRTLPAVR